MLLGLRRALESNNLSVKSIMFSCRGSHQRSRKCPACRASGRASGSITYCPKHPLAAAQTSWSKPGVMDFPSMKLPSWFWTLAEHFIATATKQDWCFSLLPRMSLKDWWYGIVSCKGLD